MVAGIFISLLLLLIPAALAGTLVAVVNARRLDGDERVPGGIGTARRLFLYGIGIIALAFAATGVAMLIGGALDAVTGTQVIDARSTTLAVALSFATVGIPVWAVLVLLAHRAMRAYAVERRSQARRWYLGLARGGALVVGTFNAVEAARFLVGVEEFSGAPWGWAFAMAAAWLIHDRLAAAEPAETATTLLLDRLYRYFATVFGLAFLLVGAVLLVEVPLGAAYDGAFRAGLVAADWSERWREAALILVAGLGVWWWHWLRGLVHDDRGTTLWRIAVFLVGILVAVLVTVTATGTVLHAALQWFFGEPRSERAADHFATLPALLSAALVGVGSWSYHRVVLLEELPARQARTEPERIYRYVLSASGLVAVASGVTTMLALLLEVLAGGDANLFEGEGWWRNALVVAVTLLLVGGPLWGYSWWRTQQTVIAGGAPERAATSRRVYLFGIFGIAALFLLVDLTIVLFQLFEALLDTGLTRAVVRDTRWSIAIVVTAGAVAVYHWLVMREDQAERAEEPPAAATRRREIILVAAVGRREAVLAALQGVDGVTVRTWEHLGDPGGALPAAALAAMAEEVAAAQHEHLLLVVDGDRYRLLPYRA